MRGKSLTCREALSTFRSMTGSKTQYQKEFLAPASHRLAAHRSGTAIWSVPPALAGGIKVHLERPGKIVRSTVRRCLNPKPDTQFCARWRRKLRGGGCFQRGPRSEKSRLHSRSTRSRQTHPYMMELRSIIRRSRLKYGRLNPCPFRSSLCDASKSKDE